MKKAIFFVYFICLVVSGLSAQNWDINTLHRVNSWDGKFVRNYNKIISRSEPYVAVGVPVAMAVAAWIKHDKGLLKDAVYVGTSVLMINIPTECMHIAMKAARLFLPDIRRRLLPLPPRSV